MRFFTPDLYARLQGPGPSAMDAADAEWERAETAYAQHIRSIRPGLPDSVCELLDETRLHDAEVLWMGRSLPFFGILLRLDVPPHATLLLNYFLLAPPRLDTSALPPEHRTAGMQWLYDEVDSAGSRTAGFQHTILFSNGWELQLQAGEVHRVTLDTVYTPAEVSVTA
ncbi:MAG: hypothetical protein WD069_09945 [Planctomycetales bacterium]